MIYFTSDLHLGHEAIIHMQNRPFSNAEDMNKQLIKNINSFVGTNDTLYIVGDISYRLSTEKSEELIKKIHGKKIFIKGNHDKDYDKSLFEFCDNYVELVYKGIKFDIMHYPLRSWNGMRHGAIQVHGHIHATEEYNERNREKGIYQYDVGVDANDYYPVSIEAIIDYFKDVPLIDFNNDYYEK